MATSYPGGIDSLPRPTASTLMSATGFEGHTVIDNLSDAVEAIETELGTNPSAAYATVSARIAAAEAAAAAVAPELGQWDIDTRYSGTDDQKLGDFLAEAAAATYKPTGVLSRRKWTFSTSRNMFSGLKLMGAGGGALVEQPRGGTPYATLIDWNGSSLTAGWLNIPASTIHGVYIANLAFEGDINAPVFSGASGHILQCSEMHNITAAGAYSVLGTDANPLVLQSVTFAGHWNINNSRHCAVHLQGSDNWLWMDGNFMLDSSPTYTDTLDPGYLMRLSFLSKTTIGGLYLTCEGRVAGIRITGASISSANSHGLILQGVKVEGRNATQHCDGPLIWVEGNKVILRDVFTSYAMGTPADSYYQAGVGAGYIHQTGGNLQIDGAFVGRATGVDEDIPYVYATGSDTRTRIGRVMPLYSSYGGNNNAWTGKPRWQSASSAQVIVDDTVQSRTANGAKTVAPGALVLGASDDVPTGTPAGTIIYRTA
jgi:hypothetical protein